MKRLTTTVLAICFIVLASVTASLVHSTLTKPALAQESSITSDRTITVLGLGRTTATPDSVEVQLTVGGGNMNYGPGGPEFKPFDEENMKLVEEALVSLEIDPEQIHMNPFGRSNFDPFSSAGVVRFTYNEPQQLTEFMNALLEQLDDNRGPSLQGASAAFLIDDCLALEAEAMSAAVESAKARASELAKVVDADIGQVLSLNEQSTSGTGPSMGTTCAMLDSSLNQGGFNPFTASGGAENSPSAVEVSVAVEVTFEME